MGIFCSLFHTSIPYTDFIWFGGLENTSNTIFVIKYCTIISCDDSAMTSEKTNLFPNRKSKSLKIVIQFFYFLSFHQFQFTDFHEGTITINVVGKWVVCIKKNLFQFLNAI